MTISIRQASAVTVVSGYVTTASCTLPTAPVSGNRLVWLQAVDKNAGTWTPPSGFVTRESQAASSMSMLIADKIADGNESGALSSSWTSSRPTKAIVLELQASGGATIVYDDSNSQETEAAGTSYSTGVATSGENSPFAVTMWGNDSAKSNPANPDPTGSWTGGITSYAENWFATGGIGEPGLVVGHGAVAAASSVSSTYSHDGNSDQMAAGIIIYSETGGSGPSPSFKPYFAMNLSGVIQ